MKTATRIKKRWFLLGALLSALSVGLWMFVRASSDVEDHSAKFLWSESRVRKGEATYYRAKGIGNCSYTLNDDMKVAALSPEDYQDAKYCGACAKVEGPKGSVLVKLMDQCPICKKGDLDMSGAAFNQIALRRKGRVAISWKIVSCPSQGNLQYRYKQSSNQKWAAIQVRHHQVPIKEVWIQRKGSWLQLAKHDYNYFVSGAGVDNKPFRIRVVDIRGKQIEEEIPPPQKGRQVKGTKAL